MVTLAVVPARAGSRGLPGKHLRRLGGEPLIVHTIRAALDARRVDRVIVSTNDPQVARVARRAGAEVPFDRPDRLAADDTPTAPVIRHALDWVEAASDRVDLVVTLQPTSPLRGASEVDAAIALLDDPAVESAASVAPLGVAASVVGTLRDGRFIPALPAAADARRQVAPPLMRLTGAVYVTRRRLLVDEGLLLDEAAAALVVDGEPAIDIDTLDDLRAARRAWRRRSR